MPFVSLQTVDSLKSKLVSDPKELKKIFRSKSNPFFVKNVDHNLVDDLIKNGWEEFGTPLKTKTRMRKEKPFDIKFEDDIWCQLYKLGYGTLNIDRNFHLPFKKNGEETKQIDVIAIGEETILVVECKSKLKSRKPQSLKTEFDGLSQQINGFKKTLVEIFGSEKKIQYIYATRNLRIDSDGVDAERLKKAGGFLYNDNTFEYVQGLIRSYKNAAHYQFHALLFKGKDISKQKLEIPALEGNMGGKKYYMFSIEPELLLKMGFVLHRTRANDTELPTYQRLLVPSRLKGIGNFIDDGGFFPNNVILNFTATKKNKIEFQANSRSTGSNSRHGILKIPNSYAIAYIIDGQHRIYGYANSDHKKTDTIPVVAFVNLEAKEQLTLFMDINENQKAVSATLRTTLEEDLFWDHSRLDSRMKALRSSVIRILTTDPNSPLYNKISIGEDKLPLSSRPFARVLNRAGLFPSARGNKFVNSDIAGSLYDVSNLNHAQEMGKAQKRMAAFLNIAYDFMESNLEEGIYNMFILSNRGTFAFLGLLGSLNAYVFKSENTSPKTKSSDRFQYLEHYLSELCRKLTDLSEDEYDRLAEKLGQGADTLWLRTFQGYVNDKFSHYSPEELSDWRQRQDQELQDQGRKIGNEIEKHLKTTIIGQLKTLFGTNWELEIGSIQRQCEARAAEQREKNYKEGLEKKEIKWTEQFFIKDYKDIIEKYWTKKPDEETPNFSSFSEIFAIDVGHGFNSKNEKTKWLSIFNTYRNSWAHEATKEKGLNQDEVNFLIKVHKHLGC